MREPLPLAQEAQHLGVGILAGLGPPVELQEKAVVVKNRRIALLGAQRTRHRCVRDARLAQCGTAHTANLAVTVGQTLFVQDDFKQRAAKAFVFEPVDDSDRSLPSGESRNRLRIRVACELKRHHVTFRRTILVIRLDQRETTRCPERHQPPHPHASQTKRLASKPTPPAHVVAKHTGRETFAPQVIFRQSPHRSTDGNSLRRIR